MAWQFAIKLQCSLIGTMRGGASLCTVRELYLLRIPAGQERRPKWGAERHAVCCVTEALLRMTVEEQFLYQYLCRVSSTLTLAYRPSTAPPESFVSWLREIHAYLHALYSDLSSLQTLCYPDRIDPCNEEYSSSHTCWHTLCFSLFVRVLFLTYPWSNGAKKDRH